MVEALKITVNADGTATAEVGSTVKTLPDLRSAVTWAEALLYDLEGEESG